MDKLRIALASSALLGVLACGAPPPSPAQTPAPAPTTAPTPGPAATSTPEEKVTIRFATQASMSISAIDLAEEAWAESFNDSQDRIEVVIEWIYDMDPDDILTRIAFGDPPDIIGPVGTAGANAFAGHWLDLDPYLEGYDLSDYHPRVLDTWRAEGCGLIGLPIAVYPSAIFYNRDLFDTAGLPYPPHRYGEPYADGEAWTVEKMSEISMLLTLDASGRNATHPGFDPETVVQFGYHPQWSDPRGVATLFGAGSFVDENGQAVIPGHWRAAYHWWYEGMWAGDDGVVFMPNGPYLDSDLLLVGNAFGSGHVAMAAVHSWYTCCLGSVENWDLAAVPSANGRATAKLHTDMIGITDLTSHPQEAVEVLYALVTDPQVLVAWEGPPARTSLQADYFAALDEQFPQEVDWQVFVDGLEHVDIPNHEGWMPNTSAAQDLIWRFGDLLQNTPNLDVDAAVDQLRADLQAVFSFFHSGHNPRCAALE